MIAPDEASRRQIDAAAPQTSVWLAANAGSGKTRVLTDRVARLLLAGTNPQNILCLTYTKAAAAEMQNRLFRRLGTWAMLPDDPLRADLAALGAGEGLTAARLARARTLFAQAMEVPGGLRIQTIHAFCAGLLRRFPLEAGVSPGFVEMEDRAAQLLRAEVMDAMSAGPGQALVDELARHHGGGDLDRLLQAIVGQAERFDGAVDAAALRAALHLPPGLTAQDLIGDLLGPGEQALLADLVAALWTGSPRDVEAAERLAPLLMAGRPRLSDVEVLEKVFLYGDKAKSGPYTAKVGAFPTKDTRGKLAERLDELTDWMVRVERARPLRQALNALDRSLALHRFAASFVPAYGARKAQAGALDFDDLIVRARALLTDDKVAQWVLFRLDGGLDHILVDEAQDTSPAQWAVIERLAQEFAAGQGARGGTERTIFVVGDRKQSIYSFQGADPAAFGRMEDHFRRELGRIDRALLPLRLDWSFRSAPAVLRAVDMTFADPAQRGLGLDPPQHLAFHDTMPGRVDLWPVVPPASEAEEADSWTAPVDRLGRRHPTVELAERIAARLKAMIGHETVPVRTAQGWQARPLRAGDVLILVPRRSPLFAAIIRALKKARVPVAGADRLRLGGELAVGDIAAMLRFLALPEDDLSLAEVLRSPLLGWGERDLYHLAQGRAEGEFLWAALRAAALDHPQTMAILDDLRGQADFLRPYDLINRLLVRHGGRQRLLARLGPEAEDGIDALLAQALAYERTRVPGLTGFLAWMETEDIEVKRRLDSASDLVRVMTVHGAKGLESPVVVLPDTAVRAAPPMAPLLGQDPVLWSMARDTAPPALRMLADEAAERAEDERRRLLYVAMTRAESWLIVAGAGKVGEGEDSWYSMVSEGLTRAGAVAHAFGEGPGLRLALGDWALPPAALPAVAAPAAPALRANWPAMPHQPGPLPRSPADLGGAKVLPGEVEPDLAETAKARGSFVHLLLEHLPAIPPPDRRTAAQALWSAFDRADLAGDPAPLVADVLAMLDSPAPGHLLSQGRAEVELTAELPDLGGERLTGAVDRLIVTGDHVTVIDYKTNRLVPGGPDAVPEGILRQMGAYLAMLAQIWPDRATQAAVLWTANATLMPLPRDLCMAALRRAARP